MRKLVPILISGSLLASLLLAGCSANSETEETAAANDQADTGSSAQQTQANRNQQNGGPNMSMNFGKIKSVSDTTLTIYTSDMPTTPQGAGEGGEQHSRGGTPPERPDGEQSTGNGAAPEGGMPQGEMREGGGQGRGQGGRMQQSFSDETIDITIDADTKIVAVTFDNGTRQENAITLSELKADDIIQYTLKSDSTVAESITLSNGNPGGTAPDGSTSNSSS
ncbi:hypothetical protein ACDZ28_12810 [Paenibacillus sp. RS8]|uniref:hypothetical protein n=1 Tax=Paenibacillus sp. RS8 TaxID=3242681 RepID=UPI0035BFA04A